METFIALRTFLYFYFDMYVKVKQLFHFKQARQTFEFSLNLFTEFSDKKSYLENDDSNLPPPV